MNAKLAAVIILAAIAILTPIVTNRVQSQQNTVDQRSPVDKKTRRERFSHSGQVENEDVSTFDSGNGRSVTPQDARGTATEAPTGFDNLTNGHLVQGPDFDSLDEDTVEPLRSFNDNRFIFEEVETVADGVGPTYNAQSCRECHQNVVTGGASQVTVQRAGEKVNGQFFESLGGSLIHSRATYADIVERLATTDNVQTFRVSPTTLGDGFIEAIANSTLLAIRDNQPLSVRGTVVLAPVLEGNGNARIGRFGWKSQHASLHSFALDAYLNEMGITTPLMPDENSSNGLFVGYTSGYDPLPEPEDDGVDALAFAEFMRATKAPSRGTITAGVLAGERLFSQVGCAVCHISSITTARAGSVVNGGSFTVSNALGNKIIHPYSDFLLHNIGTGDGIPILPTPQYALTANQIRTAPLWGLRARNRLMHDGLSFTLGEAIQRHAGQASRARSAYGALTNAQKNQLLIFLNSL